MVRSRWLLFIAFATGCSTTSSTRHDEMESARMPGSTKSSPCANIFSDLTFAVSELKSAEMNSAAAESELRQEIATKILGESGLSNANIHAISVKISGSQVLREDPILASSLFARLNPDILTDATNQNTTLRIAEHLLELSLQPSFDIYLARDLIDGAWKKGQLSSLESILKDMTIGGKVRASIDPEAAELLYRILDFYRESFETDPKEVARIKECL